MSYCLTRHLSSFRKAVVLVELDQFIKKDKSFDLNDYIPGLIADGYYEGKLYAMPVLRSTPLLYVNGDMLAEAGLPRRAPKTWDEFREFSKKVTKYNAAGEPIQLGAALRWGQPVHTVLPRGVYALVGKYHDDSIYILPKIRNQTRHTLADMVSKIGPHAVKQPR